MLAWNWGEIPNNFCNGSKHCHFVFYCRVNASWEGINTHPLTTDTVQGQNKVLIPLQSSLGNPCVYWTDRQEHP